MIRVTGERDGPLLERDHELSRIQACLQRARHGHGGALVVEGPAGIGKTVLLAVARDAALDGGFRVLRARGAELQREFAFGVVRQLFEPVVVGASEGERALMLDGPPGVAARLLALPGPSYEISEAPPFAPDPSFAVMHGLYWLCANLAAERPLALVVDDAHWADGASLRFLAFLLSRLEELHAAMLLGARPAEAGASEGLLAALTVDPATEVVTVGPLTTRGVATLVADGLGVEPEPEFALACWEATGGTPFLVHALVEALRQEQIAPITSSARNVHQVATATLDRWATLQLVHLGPHAARLARAVAVLERSELPQAARLAGLTLLDAASAADLLVRAGLLDETPLCFTHPLLRAAVYHDMAAADRAETHRLAARLLTETHASPARIAEHLLATIPAGDEWVIEQLQAATNEATTSGVAESAATYLRRALAEPPRPEARANLLLELGLAEFSSGQPGWHAHLEEAVESAGDDTARVAAALAFSNVLGFHQRLEEAVDVCDRVAARLDTRNTEGHLMLEAMAVAVGSIDAAVAPRLRERSTALIELATHRPVPRYALAVAADEAALTNQPADLAADLARRSISDGPRSLPLPDDPPWFPNAVIALFYAERYVEAQTLLDAAVAEAQAAANGMILPPVLALRAWLGLRRSDLTAAEADARAMLDATVLSAPLLFRLLATGVLIEALVERGDLDEAERTLDPMAAELHGTSQTAAVLRRARGCLLFAQGHFGQSLDDFRAVGEILGRTGTISPCFLPWRSDAALAALAIADRDAARRLGDEEVELARAFGAPRALGVSLRAAGIVAGDQRGEALLREAIEVLAGPDTRLEHARVLADLGAVLRRGNHRLEARELLRQAIEAAHHIGAEPLAQQAETELRASGARPRRVLLTGLEALTASERRIAELAAGGLTNREIAQTLFVTARTVEGHLTHVFYKLDVKDRTRLPVVLAAPTQAVRA